MFNARYWSNQASGIQDVNTSVIIVSASAALPG